VGYDCKLTTIPGKRDELIRILRESAPEMPGCFSYVVAKDAADENVIWVTEVWDSEASHDASLSLPAVKNAIPQAKPIVSAFEKVATTSPVWGLGSHPPPIDLRSIRPDSQRCHPAEGSWARLNHYLDR
jgi:quinol monooxygenase YgiN